MFGPCLYFRAVAGAAGAELYGQHESPWTQDSVFADSNTASGEVIVCLSQSATEQPHATIRLAPVNGVTVRKGTWGLPLPISEY